VTDRELLAQYAANASPEAFAELVHRHAGAVHETSQRIVGDPGAAEDVTQGVFIALSRRAGSLSRRTVLAAWLHEVTRNAALDWLRGEARHRRHEQEAAEMRAMQAKNQSQTSWDDVCPKLDAAVASLSPAQRSVILLRHFHDKPEAEVAEELGWSRSRVSVTLSRAIATLRKKLARSGASVPAVALGAMLAEKAGAVAVPANLVASIQSACLGRAAASAAAMEIGEGIMKAMLWVKIRIAAGLIGGALIVGGGAATVTALAAAGPEPAKLLPPPPWNAAEKLLPDHIPEHLAFTTVSSGKAIGGPARWAVGGLYPMAAKPTGQAGIYTGEKDSDYRVFIADQRRRFWLLEKGEIWPIAAGVDLGETDGPGSYASFIYTGAYGGFPGGMAASKDTLFVMDNGWLRRIREGKDGVWQVETVAGKGKKTLAPGETGALADLAALGKGLTTDAEGNLYFCCGGGIVKADRDGRTSWVITGAKVSADMAAVYAQKWPGEKMTVGLDLGAGEGVGLQVWKDGSVYGGGRCWPSSWKVTADGKFVPLADYAPKGRMSNEIWGPGDPACFAPRCSFGWGITEEGYVWHQNEIPNLPKTRYETDKNQVTVLKADLTWGLLPPGDTKGVASFPIGMWVSGDGRIVEKSGPGFSPCTWVRLRKIR
jgi:RNA polymerase sigma-70 factor (ECF subfamily)